MSFRMLFTAEGISTSIDVQNNTPANELAAGRGCCEAVTHLANVRAIGAVDTWDVDVVYNSADLSGAVLSQKTGITATGLYKMDLVSGVQHGHASAFPNR